MSPFHQLAGLAVHALVWLLLVPRPASAEVRVFAEDRVRVELPGGWYESQPQLEASEGTRLLASYTRDSSRLVITRLDVANLGAWRGRDEFYRRVERSALGGRDAQTRLRRRRRHRVDRVPTLDLVFDRQGPLGRERVYLRTLFFWRYSVSIAVAAPSTMRARARRELTTIVTSLRPLAADR